MNDFDSDEDSLSLSLGTWRRKMGNLGNFRDDADGTWRTSVCVWVMPKEIVRQIPATREDDNVEGPGLGDC